MTAAKRNRSEKKLGKRRGVPIQLARMIARKYSLTHIVMFVTDIEHRSRIVYFAKNDECAAQLATFCEKLEKSLGWKTVWDWDCSSVKRLKGRIKELEAALAQIVDGEKDVIGIARAAGKFPIESDEENLGAWCFFPQAKLNPAFAAA